MITELLVATIPLIPGIEKHDNWKRKRVDFAAIRVTLLKRSVRRGVVDNQDVDFVSILKFDGNPEDYLANGLLGVIGDNENKNSRLSVVVSAIVLLTRPTLASISSGIGGGNTG